MTKLTHYYNSFKQLQTNHLDYCYIIIQVTLNHQNNINMKIAPHPPQAHKPQDNISNKVTYKTTQMDNHTTLTCHLIHTVTTNFKSSDKNVDQPSLLKSMAFFDQTARGHLTFNLSTIFHFRPFRSLSGYIHY